MAGEWVNERVLGFSLKITPCHEFARYAAAKYRSRGYEWKNARGFLGRRPRGLLGGRPRTHGRRCSNAGFAGRASSRSKRHSYIRRRAVAGKVAKSPPRGLPNPRAARVPALSLETPVTLLRFAFRRGDSRRRDGRVTHARPPRGERHRILIGGSASTRDARGKQTKGMKKMLLVSVHSVHFS